MRYLAVRYEDLDAEPEKTLEGVFQFLGVDCSQSVVRDCCAAGSFERVSGGRTRGQEDRGSFFRKGTTGDWRNHLSDETNKAFEEEAGDWLIRFGYFHSGSDDKTDASPAIVFESALSLHQQGRFREAERLYRAVLQADRNSFHTLFNLGVMRAQQGRFKDAIKLLRRVVAIEPDHPGAQNNLRLAVLAHNREVIARCEQMVRDHPRSAEAHIALGNALKAAGRSEEANKCFEQALATAPKNATARERYQLGRKGQRRVADHLKGKKDSPGPKRSA